MISLGNILIIGIARKGNTAQEIFISTELSKDELKEIIDLYNKK